MVDTVKNPVLDVFTIWGDSIESVVGKGNYSMEDSSVIARTPYARLFQIGNPGTRWDLEGDECATTPSYQVDCFASGQKALSKVYEIDEVSHKAMTSMGFRRTYGPEPMRNIDSKIKRVTSRYSRLYTGQLLVRSPNI